MEKDFDKNAYEQSYVIVNFLLQSGEIVVSDKLMTILENKRNKSYKFNINDVSKVELLPDTEKILTEVFLESIANKKEKEQIIQSVSNLRKLIINEQTEEKIENLLPMNLATLKWSDKFKIAIIKILNLANPAGKTSKRLKQNAERMV